MNFVTSLLCIIFLVCPFDEFCCVFVMCSWWVSLPPCYASPLVSFITSLLCTLSELFCLLVVPCLLAMSSWWIVHCFIDVHHLLLCTCGALWQLHLMYHFDPVCSLLLVLVIASLLCTLGVFLSFVLFLFRLILPPPFCCVGVEDLFATLFSITNPTSSNFFGLFSLALFFHLKNKSYFSLILLFCPMCRLHRLFSASVGKGRGSNF